MSASSEAARPPRPRRRGARWLLALASLASTLLLGECGVRCFVPRPAPHRASEGLYFNTLRKVDGFDTRLIVTGESLPEKKRPGELRIAVFGESTVQGSPWDSMGSPPTMLRDQLVALYPGRDLTIINMGRGAGYSMDAYYFLVSLKTFALDYVIVYEGANDEYKVDREMCLPSTHPHLHAAWRWIVTHSRLAFTLRAVAPGWLLDLQKKNRSGQTLPVPPPMNDACDAKAGFASWTNAIIETAQSWGARVVVATAVSNPLRWAERDGQFGLDRPLEVDDRDEGYRRMLGCMLTPTCDLATTWEAIQGPTRHFSPIGWLEPRVAISLRAAADHGARSIDFNDYLAKHLHSGLSPLVFVDEMHLTLEGEWLLAWLWTREVAALIDGRALPAQPPALDRARYLEAITLDQRRGEPCIELWTVPTFLRANMPLVASVQLRLALQADPPDPKTGLAKTRAGLVAQLVSGWLRQRLHGDPALPPSLAALLPTVSIPALAEAAQRQRDCSTMGDDRIASLVTDPTGGYHAPPAPTGNVAPDPHGSGFVVPPHQEAAILSMLTDATPAGCTLGDIAPDHDVIHVSYECATGKVVIDLRHPSTATAKAANVAARTERFAVLPIADASEAFVRSLAESLRTTEARFSWVDSRTLAP